MCGGDGLEVRENHFDVASKLPQDLAARSTWGRGAFGIGDNHDAPKRPEAFRDGFEDGDALGAHRESVRGILDVAAGDDLSIIGLERSADLETRIIGDGPFTGRAGGIDERIRGGQ